MRKHFTIDAVLEWLRKNDWPSHIYISPERFIRLRIVFPNLYDHENGVIDLNVTKILCSTDVSVTVNYLETLDF